METKNEVLTPLQLNFFDEIFSLPKIGSIVVSLPTPEKYAKKLKVIIQAYYFELYLNPKKVIKAKPQHKINNTFIIAGREDYKPSVIFGNLLELIFKFLFKYLIPNEVYSVIYLAIRLLKRTQDGLFDLSSFSVDDVFERASIKSQISLLSNPKILYDVLNKLFTDPKHLEDNPDAQTGFLVVVLVSKILQKSFKYKMVLL